MRDDAEVVGDGALEVVPLSVFTRDSAKVGCGGGSPPDHLGLRLVIA